MSKCLAFFSAKSTCCVKLHKTAENVGAKSEKCLCEQLRCPKHAERGKSTRRFKFCFRLSAAEQAKGHRSHLFVGSGGCDWACLRKHAEPGKSARRFRTSLRLTAAEQTPVHIGSSNPVAATSDDAGNVFVQAVELRASSGMLSLMTLSLLTGVHLDSNVRGSSTVSSAVASRSK